jgi:hypothetical protein
VHSLEKIDCQRVLATLLVASGLVLWGVSDRRQHVAALDAPLVNGSSSAALDALPWDERIGLERAMAESDPRYAPKIVGASARIESRGVSAQIARTALLTFGEHEATLRATAIARGGRRMELAEVDAAIVGAEVRAERAPGVVEWWRSLASGLEHGVTLAARPEGDGPLALTLELRGLETRGEGDAIDLVDDGDVVARYAHLAVLDASGARVPARMRATPMGIEVEIDDAQAEYPLIVDPLVFVEQEATLLGGSSSNAQVGFSVALTESGDRALVGGYADEVMGVEAGSARVFARTGATWVQEALLEAPDGAEADWLGYSVALTATGDRALVGAPNDDTAGGTNAGSARVFVRTGTTWTQEATLLAPDGAMEDAATLPKFALRRASRARSTIACPPVRYVASAQESATSPRRATDRA